MWSSLVSSLVPPIDAASQVRRPQIDSDYENVRSHLHPECGECEPSAASTSEATPRSTTTTGTALCSPMPWRSSGRLPRQTYLSPMCSCSSAPTTMPATISPMAVPSSLAVVSSPRLEANIREVYSDHLSPMLAFDADVKRAAASPPLTSRQRRARAHIAGRGSNPCRHQP
jgi:hypothetical protein